VTAVSAPEAPRRGARAPTLAHRLEYGALRGFLGALAPFGVSGGAAIAGRIARAGYWPLGVRAAVTRRQIAAAFPTMTRSQVRQLSRESYDSLGRVAVEASLLAARGSAAVLDRFVDSPEWGVLERAHASGKGVVLMAGHVGNWELCAAYVAARGMPIHVIVRGMSNPLSEEFLRRVREGLGAHVVHDQESVRKAPKALREGAAVGVVSDQATVGLASTVVPFFGRPAKTPRGAAVFALRLGAPVVHIRAIRQADGRYRFEAEEVPVVESGDREHDVDEIIRRFTEQLEAVVRRVPGQYFWQHRRWKHQPADTPAHLREP
jgi:KDO2-lipid IV(A) lauroyltransferase